MGPPIDCSTTRTALSVRLLGAVEGIPDPAIRVGFVDGLALDHYLTPAEIYPVDDGPLVGLLIEKGIIEDNQDAFSLVKGRGWDSVGP